jgi:hypothetical protein
VLREGAGWAVKRGLGWARAISSTARKGGVLADPIRAP